MLRKQKGITLIGFLVVLMVVGFFAYSAMQLVPLYSTDMGVLKAMKQLQSDTDNDQVSVETIRGRLGPKLDIQYVPYDMIPPQNIQLKKVGGKPSLRIFYDRQVPFIYNVDLLVHFDHTVDLSRQSY